MNTVRSLFVFLFSLLFLCSACSSSQHLSSPASIDFFAMDTYMRISAYGDNAELYLSEVKDLILSLEALWSVSLPDSEINLLNHSGSLQLSDTTVDIISTAKQLSADTQHYFDITVYPLVKAWGFTSDQFRIPDDEELASLLNLVGSDDILISGNTVRLKEGMQLDLGAIAKGFASDLALQLLVSHGVSSALLSLGGNVQVLGSKPNGDLWNIAIQDPNNPAGFAGSLKLSDKAVVTSGSYQRFFELDGCLFHHLLDPATGYPVNNGLASVTVIADNAAFADALATALFVMGEELAFDFYNSALFDFELILIRLDGSIRTSLGISNSFSAN